jgi:2-polyprenyl-3-methyl-5-hydroxy-6-metoxy-1,4-benzoquinol methylase
MATVPTIGLDRCPACHAARGEDFSLGAAPLRRCAGCTTVYARRYADPAAVYRDGYYARAAGFGIDVGHPRFQSYLREVDAQRAHRLTRATRGPGRLLDVGCGTGGFLAAARERGWAVAGVDLIPSAVEVARGRGLDVRTGRLEDSGNPQAAWDVVSALHVLEHVPDALTFLRTLARWVRPGGRVVVESPNWGSRLRRAQGARWVHLAPLEHVVHWDPASLAFVLRHAGLERVEVRTGTWRSTLHTRQQAAADLGRPGLDRLPARIAPAATELAREIDGRRGRGMVVWGQARVP